MKMKFIRLLFSLRAGFPPINVRPKKKETETKGKQAAVINFEFSKNIDRKMGQVIR